VPIGAIAPVNRRPAVIQGLSTDIPAVSDITVALRTLESPAEANGWYAQETQILIVSPVANPEITLAHHESVYDAVAACFPVRPPASASDEDKAEWAQLHAALSSALETACGYRAGGWSSRTGVYSKRGDRVEQPLIVRIGAVHPDA
jgi:hypothetical protein